MKVAPLEAGRRVAAADEVDGRIGARLSLEPPALEGSGVGTSPREHRPRDQSERREDEEDATQDPENVPGVRDERVHVPHGTRRFKQTAVEERLL